MSDTLKIRDEVRIGNRSFMVWSLPRLCEAMGIDLHILPYSLRVLLENVARAGGRDAGKSLAAARAFAEWAMERRSNREIEFRPSRVLMQDFTGVPAVVDLAAMRDAVAALNGDPVRVNPVIPVDLVIDHSVQVDYYGSADACRRNVALEMSRNRERYELLRWACNAFGNLRVVPPGRGICHQVNLEHLASVVATTPLDGATAAFPDTLVGTDSHTPTVNGLGVLGWGVGGIEAEAAMLGQPIVMQVPEVVGVRLSGTLPEGATATDLVLTVTEMLRKTGVVGKFVEFCGPGLSALPPADRATVANMAPEYGATCGFFPVDAGTLDYLSLTGRPAEQIELVEAYARAQGLWREEQTTAPVFSEQIDIDLSAVEPSIAGPKRPQDRISLSDAAREAISISGGPGVSTAPARVSVQGKDFELGDGDVVIASITSCTNTSNPHAMLTAGLLARNANRLGLRTRPWVKTSLAPGSRVVTDYLRQSGLQEDLDALGFNLVGYGCMTCIGNSGPLDPAIEGAIREADLDVAAVLSGNRNFEGRVHALTRRNFLMSPALVVAYALAGSMRMDLTKDPIGQDMRGSDVYLADIWPAAGDIEELVRKVLNARLFAEEYSHIFEGDEQWESLPRKSGSTYAWNNQSTYIRMPPFFEGMTPDPPAVDDVRGAAILALLGDSITTDHISPAGSIPASGPAGKYLLEHGVEQRDFNSYGSRRGNHEVMMRGAFANIRIRNEMAQGKEGGYTTHVPSGSLGSIYDVAMKYQEAGVPLVVVGGKEYGAGSSRDWAAKGASLLGVRAVIAESFERIHRSNLAGMGVLPLTFPPGMTRHTLGLKGDETVDIEIPREGLAPRREMRCTFTRAGGEIHVVKLVCRLDTADDIEFFRHGGILRKVVRNLAAKG